MKIIKKHHLKNVPNPVAEGLEALFKMSLGDDVQQQAAEFILAGKPIGIAIRHARAQVKRDLQSSGWVSLDFANDCMLTLLEKIAAPVQEEIEKWRVAELPQEIEEELENLALGTAAIARKEGLSQRRIQQKLREREEGIVAGQGELFGGVQS